MKLDRAILKPLYTAGAGYFSSKLTCHLINEGLRILSNENGGVLGIGAYGKLNAAALECRTSLLYCAAEGNRNVLGYDEIYILTAYIRERDTASEVRLIGNIPPYPKNGINTAYIHRQRIILISVLNKSVAYVILIHLNAEQGLTVTLAKLRQKIIVNASYKAVGYRRGNDFVMQKVYRHLYLLYRPCGRQPFLTFHLLIFYHRLMKKAIICCRKYKVFYVESIKFFKSSLFPPRSGKITLSL